jgi:hypothetical protein
VSFNDDELRIHAANDLAPFLYLQAARSRRFAVRWSARSVRIVGDCPCLLARNERLRLELVLAVADGGVAVTTFRLGDQPQTVPDNTLLGLAKGAFTVSTGSNEPFEQSHRLIGLECAEASPGAALRPLTFTSSLRVYVQPMGQPGPGTGMHALLFTREARVRPPVGSARYSYALRHAPIRIGTNSLLMHSGYIPIDRCNDHPVHGPVLHDTRWSTRWEPEPYQLVHWTRQTTPTGGVRQFVALLGLPSRGVELYWNAVADEYDENAGSHGGEMSLLPHLRTGTAEPVQSWAVWWEKESEAVADSWRTRALTPLRQAAATLVFSRVPTRSGHPLSVRTRVVPMPREEAAALDSGNDGAVLAAWIRHLLRQPAVAFRMDARDEPAAALRSTVRVGALDLTLATASTTADAASATLPRGRVTAAAQSGGGLGSITAELELGAYAAVPGGQDPFEAPAADGDRPPPIVIPLAPDHAVGDPRLVLVGRQTWSAGPRPFETTFELQSFKAAASRLPADSTPAPTPDSTPPPTPPPAPYCEGFSPERRNRVVVIDTRPFLVALVLYPDFLTASDEPVVAEWRDGAWTLAGEMEERGAADACLVLPAQAVGEEIEVERDLADRENRTLDYRLGPPARLSLNLSAAPVRYRQAPWNLRRIFSDPRVRETDVVTVTQLQFELLYGLSCTFPRRDGPGAGDPPPALRAAEIALRIGDPRDALGPPRWQATSQLHRNALDTARKRWDELRSWMRARLYLLEPFVPGQRFALEALTIREGLACKLLAPGEIDTRNRFERINDPAALRGGALWAVEQGPVYEALLRHRNPTDKELQEHPHQVTGLGLSALGGYGLNDAAFDSGLSGFEATVTMGQLERLVVRRVGRIGVFWNRAVHVSVFERTLEATPQFQAHQTPLAGRAVVRKVSEYIEIVEPVAEFTRSGAGFVKATHFPADARIPVRSAWGAEVGDVGWKVPLWNAAAFDAEPSIYPKPEIHLACTGVGVRREEEVQALLTEPQNVYFFTLTADQPPGAGSGFKKGDPATWPPIEGVDFVAYALPQAPPMPADLTHAGELATRTIPDPSTPLGFERVTFRVRLPDARVNLLAGVRNESLAGDVETLTLMRGSAGAGAPAADAGLEAVAGVQDAYEAVSTALRTLAGGLGDAARLKAVLAAAAPPADLSRELAAAHRAYRDALARLEAGQTEMRSALGRRAAAVAAAAGEITAAHRAPVDRFVNGIPLGNGRKSRGYHALLIEAVTEDVELAAWRGITDLNARAARVAQWRAGVLAEVRALPSSAEPLAALLVRTAGSLRGLWLAWSKDSATWPAVADAAGLRQRVEAWEARLAAFEAQVADLRAVWMAHADTVALSLTQPFRAALETLEAERASYEDTTKALEQALRDRLHALVKAVCGDPGAANLAALLDRLERCDVVSAQLDGLEREILRIVGQGTLPGDWAEAGKVALVAMAGRQVAELGRSVEERAQALAAQVRSFGESQKALLLNEKARVEVAVAALVTQAEAAGREQLREGIDQLERRLGGWGSELGRSLRRDLQALPRPAEWDAARAASDQTFRLVRAFGRPPDAANLNFGRGRIGYYFKEGAGRIGITPVLARVDQVGNALKGMGMQLPTHELAERLIPPELRNFRFNDIFSDFAGLKVASLFNGIKLPRDLDGKLKITHAFDEVTRQARLDARLQRVQMESCTLFSAGPISVDLQDPWLEAKTSITAGPDGSTRSVWGKISSTWHVRVAGNPIISLVDTALEFRSPGKLSFHVDPTGIRLAPVLEFLNDLLKEAGGGEDGFNFALTPQGLESFLDLAMPPLQMGAFGVSNLRLGVRFGLTWAGGFDQLAVELGAFVGRKDAPFALVIFALGGGGYFDIRARYVLSTGKITSTLSVGINANASVAVALGPISGGVMVALGFTFEFSIGGGQDRGLRIGVLFLLRGEVSVLRLVSVQLTLMLELSYGGGVLIGVGTVSLKIKICRFFTLKVRRQVTYRLGCPGDDHAGPLLEPATLQRLATDYFALLA